MIRERCCAFAVSTSIVCQRSSFSAEFVSTLQFSRLGQEAMGACCIPLTEHQGADGGKYASFEAREPLGVSFSNIDSFLAPRFPGVSKFGVGGFGF